VFADRLEEVVEDSLVRDVVQRSFGVVGTKEQIDLEAFDMSTGILGLRNMNKRLELKRSVCYSFIFEPPFGLLENVLKK
jgi:hypothetical protein